MRMAVTATPALSTFYGEPASNFSGLNASLAMADLAGPLSLGSALTMGGASASFYNSYGDNGSFLGAPWEMMFSATPSSIFSLPSTLSPSLSFSDSSVYSTDESELLLMSSDSDEFLQQIHGHCCPISTMHPNLVSTLKNMVAPGSTPTFSNGTQAMSMLDQNPSLTHSRLEQHQQDSSLNSAFLRHCQQMPVVPKVELQDLTSSVGAVVLSAEESQKVGVSYIFSTLSENPLFFLFRFSVVLYNSSSDRLGVYIDVHRQLRSQRLRTALKRRWSRWT